MAECVRCGASEIEVRLFDAIYDFRMEEICERCSIIENIPLIKKPSSQQIKDSESGVVSVKKRLDRISDMDQEKRETFFIEDKLRELDEKPELSRPQKDQLDLIDHFHWHIQKNRRRKGMTESKLAEALGESEEVIKMIEKAKIPENPEALIRKLEQFFQVRLRKIQDIENVEGPVLLDEKGRELGFIPEPEIISKEEVEVEFEEPEVEVREYDIPREEVKKIIEHGDYGRDVKDIEVEQEISEESKENKISLEEIDVQKGVDIKDLREKLTIADLRELHRKKVDANRQEQLEEQEKIEERKRLIMAKKEELMMRKEKESRDIDKYLGGSELLKGERPKDNELVKEFDEELN